MISSSEIPETRTDLHFDSDEIKLSPENFKDNRGVYEWLQSGAENRFNLDTVDEYVGLIMQGLRQKKRKQPADNSIDNKLNLCSRIMHDLTTKERSAPIYTLLERSKLNALDNILAGYGVTDVIKYSDDPSEIIDGLVTTKVIESFFDYVDVLRSQGVMSSRTNFFSEN